VLTGIGNDYGFEQVFARQVRALGHRGDVFVGISTSGKSPNIISALQTARELGLITVGFTKAGPTPMGSLCDLLIPVPSEEVGLIQQIHITAAHAICNLVERALFGDTGSDT
jgi:D-sedoheptulose 7-phosphate isomerase